MTNQASFALKAHNPDVLTCIANLSNDEVFTPPEFANQMLDTLEQAWAESNKGANIWADSSVTFLDPFTKSGVFLREIVKRLIEGLEDEIEDLQARVDHIFARQVFGIGITQLTALLARRSVYCSKFANGKHSVAAAFDTEDGNIWFERVEHTWAGRKTVPRANPTAPGNYRFDVPGTGRCKFCGAAESEYARDDALETHAYAFIHTDNIKARMAELFGADMQFDVIIGNPPYQLADGGGGGSAVPIYQKFIDRAIELDPRFVVMVTPSRWFVGGRGLSEFRSKMLRDKRLRRIVDFIIDKDAFEKVNANGGVNFFLWDRNSLGDCEIVTVAPGKSVGEPVVRALDEFDVFIRRNEAVPILRKVLAKSELSFSDRVSSLKPFGVRTNFHGATRPSANQDIKLYGSGRVSWVARSELTSNLQWVSEWKVLLARATDGNENYPLPIWDANGPFIARPNEACTETYLIASLAADEVEARNIITYMNTKFFRFLVSLRKSTQDNKSENFRYVPELAMCKSWTDEELYAKYGLDEDEIAFIEAMIRPMELGDE